MSVSIADSEIYGGNGGVPLLSASGVRFKAVDPTLSITGPNYPVYAYGNTGTDRKLFSFKASCDSFDCIAALEVYRMGGATPTMQNFKVYIDLDDDGIVDANELITSDGAGDTLSNGGDIVFSYSGQGTTGATCLISNIKLYTSFMNHDIMIVGDIDQATQFAIELTRHGSSAYVLGDMSEKIRIVGSYVQDYYAP